MKRSAFGLLALCFMAMIAFAQDDSVLKDGHPERYVVRKGDTLWDISNTFLNTPWLWPEIWQVNPQIANPHLIFPGDVVSLVYIDGRPRLVVQRGRDVKLSPKVRVSSNERAVPSAVLHVRVRLKKVKIFALGVGGGKIRIRRNVGCMVIRKDHRRGRPCVGPCKIMGDHKGRPYIINWKN